jgi:CRP-like cAMP-binding protein
MTPARIHAGKVVARQGDLGQEFVVVVEGTATVAVDDVVVASLGPGDYFGEVAVLDRGPRTATVTAETDLLVEVLTSREFDALLDRSPSLTRKIVQGLAARLRATDARLAH